jgi:hypothetical protein
MSAAEAAASAIDLRSTAMDDVHFAHARASTLRVVAIRNVLILDRV